MIGGGAGGSSGVRIGESYIHTSLWLATTGSNCGGVRAPTMAIILCATEVALVSIRGSSSPY